VPGEVVTATLLNTHLRDNLLAVVPLGVCLPYTAVLTVPPLFLLADGAAVSRTTYAALFALYNADGLKFGAGDGTTTFNLPDMRGRVPVGMNPGGPVLVDALGDNDGRAQNLRSISHNHTYLRARNISDAQGGAGGVIPFQTNDAIKTTGDVNNNDYPAFNALPFIVKVLN
jgi:microcystin-dependent protein